MNFSFAKIVFYFSLASITVFALANVVSLIQEGKGEEPGQLELATQAPEASTVIISPTSISPVNTTNWNSEINAYLNVSFRYPPTWSQSLTQRDIIAHTTKDENPKGIWISVFDNPNDLSLKNWWNSRFIRSGISLSDTKVDNHEAVLEIPNQIEGNRETIRMYAKKDDLIYEVKVIFLTGNEIDKEIARLVIASLKFL